MLRDRKEAILLRDQKEAILLAEMDVVISRGAALMAKVPNLGEDLIKDQVEEVLKGKVWAYLNEEF